MTISDDIDGVYRQVIEGDSPAFFADDLYPLMLRGDASALSDLENLVEAGDIRAQYILGFYCLKGCGLGVDYERAVKLFNLAAELGDASAQYNLGICYNLGYGVESDQVKMLEWFQKAAFQGHKAAQEKIEFYSDLSK
ncbi:MAG: TPR repeat protein [Alphaproteobacteria bacterium]|jgi:TPR repeat protein